MSDNEEKQERDNRSNQLDEQHPTYHRDRGASEGEAENQSGQATRRNQQGAGEKQDEEE